MLTLHILGLAEGDRALGHLVEQTELLCLRRHIRDHHFAGVGSAGQELVRLSAFLFLGALARDLLLVPVDHHNVVSGQVQSTGLDLLLEQQKAACRFDQHAPLLIRFEEMVDGAAHL